MPAQEPRHKERATHLKMTEFVSDRVRLSPAEERVCQCLATTNGRGSALQKKPTCHRAQNQVSVKTKTVTAEKNMNQLCQSNLHLLLTLTFHIQSV